MIYQYDQALQLPTVKLYDTLIMAMALNAAKDMYERGELQIKDFLKAYGDFLTPITADQNWWNLNVTGAARDLVNSIYARGGDPLRNARDRAQISMFLNRLPYGDMAKLKSSAKNAEAYLEARRKLELEGKYNPAIEQYAGKGLDQFSTVNDGIWDRMSPVPYENMANFSKAYFDNISPVHRRASRNGISYTVSEITEPMLQDIADRHFNDLVNTPLGRLMYKMYKDQLGSDEAARQAFNDAVVSGNLDRRKHEDDYDKMDLENKKLNIDRAKLAIQRERLQIARDKARKEELERARGWTYRLRVGVMNSRKINSDYSQGLKNAKYGSTYDGARNQLIREGNKNPTYDQINKRINDNIKALGATGFDKNGKSLYALNYKSYTTEIVGNDAKTALDIAAGFNTAPEKIGDVNDTKRRTISFRPDGSLNFTIARQLIYGGTKLTEGSASNRLQKAMEKAHIQGYIPDEDHVSVSRMQYGPNEAVWDVNTYIRVKKSDLLKCYNGDLDKALKEAGGVQVGRQDRYYDTGNRSKMKYQTEEFVDIPVTRTVNPAIFSDSEIDMWHDSHYLTKSISAKRESGYEDDDVSDMD